MNAITNRPGGATDVGNFPAPTLDTEKNFKRWKACEETGRIT